MTALIPIVSRIVSGNPEETVNARILHNFLEIGRDYSNWFKDRVRQYSFVEKEDFIAIRQKRRIGAGKGLTDHYITLDMAKELAMVERNEKGKQARRYFIECEKQLKTKEQPPALPEPTQSNLFKPGKYSLTIYEDGDFHGLKLPDHVFMSSMKCLPEEILKPERESSKQELADIINACTQKLASTGQ